MRRSVVLGSALPLFLLVISLMTPLVAHAAEWTLYSNATDCQSRNTPFLTIQYDSYGTCVPIQPVRSAARAVSVTSCTSTADTVTTTFKLYYDTACSRSIITMPVSSGLQACTLLLGGAIDFTNTTNDYTEIMSCPGDGSSHADPAIVFGAVFGVLLAIALIVAGISSWRLAQRPEFAHLK